MLTVYDQDGRGSRRSFLRIGGAAALGAGGALLGGRAGAGLARRLSPDVLRWAIVVYGVTAAVILLA